MLQLVEMMKALIDSRWLLSMRLLHQATATVSGCYNASYFPCNIRNISFDYFWSLLLDVMCKFVTKFQDPFQLRRSPSLESYENFPSCCFFDPINFAWCSEDDQEPLTVLTHMVRCHAFVSCKHDSLLDHLSSKQFSKQAWTSVPWAKMSNWRNCKEAWDAMKRGITG